MQQLTCANGHTCFSFLSLMSAHLHTHQSWLDGKHVVFGQVTDGMDLVKKIESYGSQSGKVKELITIADCGEL
jgi:cyclophilin family peptidyl-prolyl cis-trans isomerase